MMALPGDIADAGTSAIPSIFNPSGHSFLTGIHCREPPAPYTTIDDELASLVSSYLNTLAITWDRIKVATASDTNMVQLTSIIESGFPEFCHELPPALREYHQFRHHLYTVDGIIPPYLRQHILTILHSVHQGVTSMTAHAEMTIFWLGITPAITATWTNCHICNRMAPSQPNASPFPPDLPAYPFQCISVDFFHYKGKNCLVVVDRYSDWPIIEQAPEGSKGLIDCLQRIFGTFGIPDECVTNGGPEFTATATCQFLKDWGVHHGLSSVAHPHSNCRAEIGVKTVKQLNTDNTDPHGSLNTDALQHAILIPSYLHTHTFIPILPGDCIPHPTWSDTSSQIESLQEQAHERSQAVDSAHQEIITSCSRTPCAYSKPDRFISQQMGQDRHHHRGLPI